MKTTLKTFLMLINPFSQLIIKILDMRAKLKNSITIIVLVMTLVFSACKKYKPAVPEIPTNLKVMVESESEINVSWSDNSNDELGFKLEAALGKGSDFSEIATVGANITTYQHKDLTSGTQYTYRVVPTMPMEIQHIQIQLVLLPKSL